MRQVGQLREIVIGLRPLFLTIVALNLVLTWAFGSAPPALRSLERIDSDALFAISARLDAVQRDLESEPVTRRDFVIVTGLSTAREGIDPTVFSRATGGGLRLLNIAGSGGSFSDLTAYSAPLLRSQLHPSGIIVGVHPSWLSGRSPQARPVNWASWISQHIWIVSNRAGINAGLHRLMLSLRSQLGRVMGLDLADLARGLADDPWAFAPTYNDTHAPPDFMTLQLRAWESFGWFDAQRFREATAETVALDNLLRRLSSLAPNRVLVLMPESSAFRMRVPAEAVDSLVQVARGADTGLQILDLRASLPDDYFRDHAHLNAAGREALSRLLGARFPESQERSR